jgi:alpha-pyrone synthase
VFGDGCAASLVSADPVGLAIDHFHATLIPETRQLITWKIRELGFDMFLSGKVPGAIAQGLPSVASAMVGGGSSDTIDLWAVHPGGSSVLDAVARGLRLPDGALDASRGVLERFGNMSSATVMFVMREMMGTAEPGQRGCAMSFGPGLTAESMAFRKI